MTINPDIDFRCYRSAPFSHVGTLSSSFSLPLPVCRPWWIPCAARRPAVAPRGSDVGPKRMFIKIHNRRTPPPSPPTARASVYVPRSFFIPAVNTELSRSARPAHVHGPRQTCVGVAFVRASVSRRGKTATSEPHAARSHTSTPGHFGSAANGGGFFYFF